MSPGLKPNLGSSSRCHFKAKMGQHWSDLDKEPFFLANEKPGAGLNILVDPFQLGVFFDSVIWRKMWTGESFMGLVRKSQARS